MFQNPIDLFYGWSDQASSFDRLAGILRDRIIRSGDLLADWLTPYKIHSTNRSRYLNVSLLKQRIAHKDFKNLILRIHAEPQIDERESAEADLTHSQKLKQRREGYSGLREVVLSQAEVLKEVISHQTQLIDIILKREIAHIVLVRNGDYE